MKLRRYILFFILILTFGNAFAHQDRQIIKDFGNVKVRITTGFKYEEIEKVFIFGQLSEELAKQLNYSKPIFLDFNHYYVENCEPDYFISYDNGNIQHYYTGKDIEIDFLKNKSIIVRQVARQFDAQTTLKLLEYAILNIEKVKFTQKKIGYDKNYCRWRINSIDTTLIKQVLNQPNSIQLDKVLNLRIEKINYEISYYLQNGKYTLFLRDFYKADTNLLTLDNIYQFVRIDDFLVIVFDTDTSFYFIDKYKVYKRQIFKNRNYIPFEVKYVEIKNEEKIFVILIEKEYSSVKYLIYFPEEDKLLQDIKEQDIDKFINK